MDGGCFSDKIDEVTEKYYGHPIREFTKNLVKDVSYARTHLKFMVDDFVAMHAKDCSGQVTRVAKRFGLLAGAITLAIEFGILGNHIPKSEALEGIVKCYRAWLDDRGTKKDLELEQIIGHVIGTIQERVDSRFPLTVPNKNDDYKTFTEIWGYREGSTFYICVEAFKKHFCVGASATDVAKLLHEGGYLKRDSGGKYTVTKKISAHTKSSDRFYAIDLEKDFNNNDIDWEARFVQEEPPLPY